jgi:hypothetical protein
VNSAWHYHSHHELRPGLPCGQQRSPLAAATRSMLCHKAASVVRGLMSKPRAPRTSVHAAPCCGIRTIFWPADQGSVRREPYSSAKNRAGAADHAHRHNQYTNRLWCPGQAYSAPARHGTELKTGQPGTFLTIRVPDEWRELHSSGKRSVKHGITATPADAADARSTAAGRWRPPQMRTVPRQPKAFPRPAGAAWRL